MGLMDDVLGLTRDEWMEAAVAAAVVVAVLAAAVVVTGLLRRLVHVFTGASATQLDDRIADALRVPVVLIATTWALAMGTRSLSFLDGADTIATRAATAITVLIVALGIRRIALELLAWQAGRGGFNARLHPGSIPLIRRGITILVVAVALLIALDTFGVSISPLLAGLGIGGLAVALALQPLLGNVFASSYMLSDSSIRIGDYVEILGGPSGLVDDIGWRATRIRSFDNNIVIVPNSTLADSTVTNFTLVAIEADARVDVGVAYESDLDEVERVCTEEIMALREEMDTAVKDAEPIVRFLSFGDSNIDVMLKMRALTWGDSFLLKHLLIKRIHARFEREGIVINYPTRRLLLNGPDVSGLSLGES